MFGRSLARGILSFMKLFLFPVIISILTLAAVAVWGGPEALILASILVVLEVTLSFDNAVVNAKVLMNMTHEWQRRFLTWGILFAVFFTRLVLPILIVSVSVWRSPLDVLNLAAFFPNEYAVLLDHAHAGVSAFGAAFLLMVSLKYFLDSSKTLHWFKALERGLSSWGRVEAVEIGISLVTVLGFSFFVPHEEQSVVLIAGLVGIILFIFMRGLAGSYSEQMTQGAAKGFALFMYLNILDTAFSLDSVVGAFALTTQIPIIVAGLGIGAIFVRTLTVYLVEHKALAALIYLEHGAHWAILGLAVSMYASLLFEIPEVITGGIGAFFVIAAYLSSIRVRKNPTSP